MVKPAFVGADTATFGLPFISLGELGAGQAMLLGNARYTSILVCPRNYSWEGGVTSEGKCIVPAGRTTDTADMANFFKNTFRYLLADKYDLSSSPYHRGNKYNKDIL